MLIISIIDIKNPVTTGGYWIFTKWELQNSGGFGNLPVTGSVYTNKKQTGGIEESIRIAPEYSVRNTVQEDVA